MLKTVFRQEDKAFVKLLNNIRFGKLDEEDIITLKSRINLPDKVSAIKPAILASHNAQVEAINQDHLKKIASNSQVFSAKFSGDSTKIDFLRKNCLAGEKLELKVGAQVMMIKNTYQKDGIINGSLGIVRGFSPKKSYPLVEFVNGKILTIGPEEWLVEKFDEVRKEMVSEAAVNQVPLILAWAITIHKSQGLTLDKISCDLSEVFSPGQAYVALSRARSLSGVFIESINFNRITSNHEAVQFYKNL